MPFKSNVVIGDKYGKLTIIDRVSSHITPKGKKYTMVKTKCDCGIIKNFAYNTLRQKIVTDCGCSFRNPMWKDKKAVKKWMHDYYLKHKDKIIKQNIITGKIYKKYKKETDPAYKLAVLLRNRLYNALKKKSKKGSAVKMLGCSTEEAIKYIEKQFLPGMTWNNWSWTGWHIDHKKPLSKFDLTDINQLKEACHYTNLQPLWAVDNIKKGNKINYA